MSCRKISTIVALAITGAVLLGARPARGLEHCEFAKLTPSDLAAGDHFGTSVAISGDLALAGSPRDDDGGWISGSAYVFRRVGGAWFQEAKLTASDAHEQRMFGVSVAIDGHCIVVGGRYYDGPGSAYVFRSDGSDWVEEAKLTAPDAEGGNLFGGSVAISGELIVVGACRDDHAGSWSGSAYVFGHQGSTWVQEAKLAAADAAPDDWFGVSVSISGERAVVGARGDADGSGSAYVFRRVGTSWTQEAKLRASDASPRDYFGSSVAIDGDLVLVGAHTEGDDGAVYVFNREGTTWVQEAKLAEDPGHDDQSDRSLFGSSVAVDGDLAAVGAQCDSVGGSLSGAAYVLRRNGTTWFHQATLRPTDHGYDTYFGSTISISGGTVLVGSLSDNPLENGGSAYVFQDLIGGEDCNANGVIDRCDLDCNGNGIPDDCDLAHGTSEDCNGNEVPDECEPDEDCNSNGVQDICDIAAGTSEDCNRSNTPDECDVTGGTSNDCNGNIIPDECEPDCNENSVPDDCDIAEGSSDDCNGNQIPDDCEADCNDNNVADDCDIAFGTSRDCQNDGIPDECQSDFDGDGLPDDCDPDMDDDDVPDDQDVCPDTPWCQLANPYGGPMGDVDDDCDVDLDDYVYLQFCLSRSGPDIEPAFQDCLDIFDFDGDSDVDLWDAAAFQAAFAIYAPEAQKIYWSQWLMGIQRANLDGSDHEILALTDLRHPGGIAIDPIARKIYLGCSWPGGMLRASLDGGDIEVVITRDHSRHVQTIALDLCAGKVYWTAGEDDRIHRANLDGSSAEVVLATGTAHPYPIALDPDGGKIYWGEGGSHWRIRRANLDGTDTEDLVTVELAPWYWRDLALDLRTGKMYWIDGGIYCANLDGSEVEEVVTHPPASPLHITVDSGEGRIYWVDFADPGYRLRRANLDGSDAEDVLTGPFSQPSDIALDPTAREVYWSEEWFPRIQRAGFDGSNVEVFLAPLSTSFALDLVGEKIYTPRYDASTGSWLIHRSNLDGSNTEEFDTEARPWALAIDSTAGKLYMLNSGPRIVRTNLDGSDVEELVGEGLFDPQAIALDRHGGKIYWTDRATDGGRVQRANIDGSDVETLTSGLDYPTDIALDVAGGKMYWIDGVAEVIQRANLDGSDVEVFVAFEDLQDIFWDRRGIAIDQRARKIYWWTCEDYDAPIIIRRASLDGSNVEDVFALPPAGRPSTIAIDFRPLPWDCP